MCVSFFSEFRLFSFKEPHKITILHIAQQENPIKKGHFRIGAFSNWSLGREESKVVVNPKMIVERVVGKTKQKIIG